MLRIPSHTKLSKELQRQVQLLRETYTAEEAFDEKHGDSGIEVHLMSSNTEWQVYQGDEADLEALLEENDGAYVTEWLPYTADSEECEELADTLLDLLHDTNDDDDDDDDDDE
jgi:hypothetical protein